MSGSWEAMIEHEEFLRRRELAKLSKVQLIEAVLEAERAQHAGITVR